MSEKAKKKVKRSSGNQLFPCNADLLKPIPNWSRPKEKAKTAIANKAFSGWDHEDFQMLPSAGGIKFVDLPFTDASYKIAYRAKAITGGGRPKQRPEELRIQDDPKKYNKLVEINQEGGIGLLFGIFKNSDIEVIAIWRPCKYSSAKKTTSKQISGYTILDALKYGIASETYPDDETVVYAMLPEFFREYISNFDVFPDYDSIINIFSGNETIATIDPALSSELVNSDLAGGEGVLGLTERRLANTRVNQCIFRELLFKRFNGQCCITGCRHKELLIASHVKPWKDSSAHEKIDPHNGLLLNSLHDAAFDKGLITIDATTRRLRISSRLTGDDDSVRFIRAYDGAMIDIVPKRRYLEWHNDMVFSK